jgi:hypothetical protein
MGEGAVKKPSAVKLREFNSRCYRIIMLPGECEICRSQGIHNSSHLEWAHLIGKRHLATRYHPLNGICSCAFHHRSNVPLSVDGHKKDFEEWLKYFRPVKFEWYQQNKNKIEAVDWDRVDATLREWGG